jgi:hypothetical protein
MRGPVDPWTSERVFCQYTHALRFPPSYQSLLARDVPGLVFFGVKRRLYPATTRNDLFHVDLQLAGRSGRFSPSPKPPSRRYSPAEIDLAVVVKAVLSVPTTVHSALSTPARQPLGRFGPPIARALDAATTTGGPSGNVLSGAPAIFLEVEGPDIVSTRWGGQWEISDGLRLAARTVAFDGRAVSVFVAVRQPPANRYLARALRIHVLRLHAEREYLRRIARLLAAEGFLEGCSQTQVERVQDALNQSLATLTRVRAKDFLTEEVATAFMADRTISGSELEVLTERVSAFRPIIRKRLQRLQDLEDSVVAKWGRFLEQNPDGRNYIYIGEAHMSQYDQRGSQIGAAGDNASASNFSFGGQLNLQTMSSADAEALQSALRTLRKHLADQLLTDAAIDIDSEEISVTEIGSAIGALSEAEEAISAKDDQRAYSALQRSGRWLASFAQAVGIEVAAAAIRAALHLP